ncbi:hypothetical protein HF086_004439 [Spodoptera exigua]|uniref:ABC transporter domain-containing protein n=1 Tax=Spodoptera exigua TaxID=7107 RepID=A0A922ML83_SPOEX|nr:hypothetical protein HF086_004439 [Spodoptera exigua]
MGTRRPAKFWPQLWATVVRNLLLKKRDTRKTLAVLVPLYSLGVLIFLKMLVPNPNFPEVRKPGRLLRIHHDAFPENHSVAVVADWLNANGTMGFLEEINTLLAESHQHPIRWIKYNNNSELNDAYHNDARNFPIAVIFHTDPTSNIEPLRYTIRTNPSHIGTPSTRILTTSPAKCRERTASKDWSSDWSRGGQLIPLSEMHGEDTCPVLQYYYSGFLALQTLIDYIKIKFDTDAAIPPPRIDLRQFPKRQHTGDWLVIFRVIMPMYMVMTLSQFITYLLMFVVGEKEKKIREGMRIMGLKESVYWGSWFLIYAVFVTILSIVSTVLLFTLKVINLFLYGWYPGQLRRQPDEWSVLHPSFVSNADSLAFWFVSLISSSCYALAMDKALVLDMAGVGVTWDNLWSGPGVPFGGSLIMMAIDTVLYGLAAYWLDAVIPSEYGIKQKPWFCLFPSFWFGSRRARVSAVHFHSNGEAAAHNKDIEPVPRELQDKEAIRIVGLQKSFRHCRKPEIKAIDNIDLSIYEGQITAVLGHNGAGKSTLFNILTGLTAPTNGTAYGIPRKRLPEEIHKALSDVGLLDQMNVFAKHLSGGQKRKLSIAIAFIGDPKIIILDEPTAGVDPVSRRQTWRILQRARHGKVLLLTTHFMDEADILGDRKAVISKGRRYYVIFSLTGVCREHQITRLVRGHVPRAEKARRHGRELSYILPHYAVHLFPPLFNAIEQEVKEKTNRLEVFLSLEGENAEETEAVEGVSSVKLVRARALSRSLSLQSKTLSYQVAPEVPISVDALGETVKTNPTCWRTFCALVYIRMVRMIRDPYKLWVMILMPIISCALGLYMKSRQIVFFRMQPLKLDPNAYLNKTPIAVYSEQDNIKEITDLRDSLESLGAFPIIDFDGNFSSLLSMENFGAFSLRDSLIPYGKIMAYYNSTYTHSLPIIVNLLDNSVYKVLMSASGLMESYKPIEVLTHPFQQTEQQEEFNLGNVVCAIFMGMIFALVPVTLAVDIVYDREIKAKNQLRVNGLSMSMYFLTYFTVLIFIMILTSVGVLVLRKKSTSESGGDAEQEAGGEAGEDEDEYKVRGTGSGGSCWSQKEETSSRVKSRFVGLARLSLAVEGGEVFGLLGHNGAGKTTTMKIITAEERPTHGSVSIFFQNIDDSQTSAFMMLGYCPQHDALWKNVTIREHIECYAAIRGVSKADTPRIVDAYLNGLQIMEHANKNADECSGGTRRKLSFALAMVGSPRVVLLDEPSTGMDPRSKRFLWDTILASFQMMESESLSPSPLRSNENSPSLGEADEGGSGTGSVCAEAEGEAEAVDASIHTPLVAGTPPPPRLQHHRTESGGGGANSEAVIALVCQIFPAAVLEESFAERLVFSVPQSAVSSLARCFQQIEDAKEKLNIVEYSFSQTTLEQVFLKFAQSENVDSPD